MSNLHIATLISDEVERKVARLEKELRERPLDEILAMMGFIAHMAKTADESGIEEVRVVVSMAASFMTITLRERLKKELKPSEVNLVNAIVANHLESLPPVEEFTLAKAWKETQQLICPVSKKEYFYIGAGAALAALTDEYLTRENHQRILDEVTTMLRQETEKRAQAKDSN